MSTGSGKSLCYQYPAAMLDKSLTVVISPLISLMKDQVDSLRERDIAASYLNSTVHYREQKAIEQMAINGDLRLLYVAPERMFIPSFAAFILKCDVVAFVIDEAHCIVQWGGDFRPDYGRLRELKKWFPKIPVHAYTASATQEMRDDICSTLKLKDPAILVGGFDRPNLVLHAERRKDSYRWLSECLCDNPGQPGIIYCMTRIETDRIARRLSETRSVRAYHAGMDDDERRQVQDDFKNKKIDIVVATIAFGMGIDRPDVRFVIHTSMPSSFEQYHQEIGRGGRDGKPANCYIFYQISDFDRWIELFESSDDASIDLSRKLESLVWMRDFCETDCCRHRYLVKHFDPLVRMSDCRTHCDVCQEKYGTK